ncbi:SCAN domain-containing protein 3 [Nephila pilipes]|uniref:SCAN domain-containing protein 3 n=1 Tax=Nephila pilipes TaxID=299642 RepID=A0A8X6MQB8_NEPPI|nr:SCAN domain-containing protein 3 [Nephila pilipes]
MDKFLRRKDSSSRTDDEEPSTSVTKNLKKVVKRKYDDYIKYGLSWCGDETAPRPQHHLRRSAIKRVNGTQKKPHTVGETLIKPACMEIVRLMLGPNEVKEVNKVSLSAETVKRRIHDMSSDILETLNKKLLAAEKFALQIDETTDIKNKAQLIAIVRFIERGLY